MGKKNVWVTTVYPAHRKISYLALAHMDTFVLTRKNGLQQITKIWTHKAFFFFGTQEQLKVR